MSNFQSSAYTSTLYPPASLGVLPLVNANFLSGNSADYQSKMVGGKKRKTFRKKIKKTGKTYKSKSSKSYKNYSRKNRKTSCSSYWCVN